MNRANRGIGRRHLPALRRQRGVALMVALVMLVIIGMASVSVMRGALSSDLIANNTRMQTLAMQAAQIALRYCEDDTVKDPRLLKYVPDTVEEAWNNFNNWSDADQVNDVPSDFMESAASTFAPAVLPRCMIQEDDTTVPGKRIYQVTAVGYSPDYIADGDGNTEAGSAVWLQSTLSIK